MSSKVRPASATAASQASMVSDSGGTISRRPIRDAPMPVIAEWSSNFSAVSIGRTYLPKSVGGISSSGSAVGASGRSDGREHRQPHVGDLLEHHLDGLAELEVVGVGVDDVGGQPDPRVLGDGDLGDHVRRGQVGEAEPVVDGEAASVAFPDTSRGPRSVLRQYRQIGAGGWISA